MMVKGVIPFLEPVTLLESQQNRLYFKALVLKWDENNPEWSTKSSNGVRYNRKATVEAFKKAIAENNGLPVLYNHIIDGEGAKVLGRITKVIDTSEGLIVEGYLDANDSIVKEKIKPGYLTNVSLQVIANEYWRESNDEEGEVIYAKPSRALEVSFVPVNGVEGAKLLDLAIAESLRSKEDITTVNSSAVMTTKMSDGKPEEDYEPKVEKKNQVEKEQTPHVRDLGKVIAIFEDEGLAEEYIQLKSMQGKWEVHPTQSGKFAVVDVYETVAEVLSQDNEIVKLLKESFNLLTFRDEKEFRKAKRLLDDNGIDYISDEDHLPYNIEILDPRDYQRALMILNNEGIDFEE